MAEETNEGIAYLMALKQSANPSAAAAAAPAAEKDAAQTAASGQPGNSSQVFRGAEKRRSPRYKCEGSVEMREEGCDVHTWASFTDVSLHGCYVEAQATYPAGTALHMQLEACGVRVETKGSVRVNYPYLGMGVAFVDMSEENKTRLRQLLRQIAPHWAVMGPGVASTLPSAGPLNDLPVISNAPAAVQAFIEFFENRQMLMREDFLRILRASQSTK